MAIETVQEPSELALVLLISTSLVFAWLRLHEARAPILRGRLLYGIDLAVAIAVVPTFGLFGDPVPSLAQESVLIPIAIGVVAGITGTATTGLSIAVMVALGGGGAEVTTWFLTPLLIGVVLRNIRLRPEKPSGPNPITGDYDALLTAPKLPNGSNPSLPAGPDLLWSFIGRVVGGVPFVVVLLTLEDGDSWVRIVGPLVIWAMLYSFDLARRPLLRPHRRSARTVDTGVFLVLMAVAAGPLGEKVAHWWAAQPEVESWHVALFSFCAAAAALLVSAPRVDGWRPTWLLTRLSRIFFGAHQLALMGATLPFLIGGVFHPSQRLAEMSSSALVTGLIYSYITVSNSSYSISHVADVLMLTKASPAERKWLIDGWIYDNFVRLRRRRRAPLLDYSLPRLAGALAELSAESSAATAGVYLYLPWGSGVRLDHTAASGLLDLAEEILGQLDTVCPPSKFGQGTPLFHLQQTARADLANRRGKVAQYLEDFEEAVAAARQAADHYTAINARAHAATVLIHTANQLSRLDHHKTSADLLSEIPEDLPPVIRRFVLFARAFSACNAQRTAAARTLVKAARSIPERTTIAFRKAFAAENIRYPHFAEGARKSMVLIELHVDRELGGAHLHPK